jgi:hypothetical protein
VLWCRRDAASPRRSPPLELAEPIRTYVRAVRVGIQSAVIPARPPGFPPARRADRSATTCQVSYRHAGDGGGGLRGGRRSIQPEGLRPPCPSRSAGDPGSDQRQPYVSLT